MIDLNYQFSTDQVIDSLIISALISFLNWILKTLTEARETLSDKLWLNVEKRQQTTLSSNKRPGPGSLAEEDDSTAFLHVGQMSCLLWQITLWILFLFCFRNISRSVHCKLISGWNAYVFCFFLKEYLTYRSVQDVIFLYCKTKQCVSNTQPLVRLEHNVMRSRMSYMWICVSTCTIDNTLCVRWSISKY